MRKQHWLYSVFKVYIESIVVECEFFKKEYFKDDCLLNQTSTSTAPLRSSDCADWAAKGETASGIFEVDLAGKKYTPEIHW